MTDEGENNHNDNHESSDHKAREEAKARRQKILQSTQDRYGVVTGETKEDADTKSKTLSKMALARRRRFKKKEGHDDDEQEQEKVVVVGAVEVAAADTSTSAVEDEEAETASKADVTVAVESESSATIVLDDEEEEAAAEAARTIMSTITSSADTEAKTEESVAYNDTEIVGGAETTVIEPVDAAVDPADGTMSTPVIEAESSPLVAERTEEITTKRDGEPEFAPTWADEATSTKKKYQGVARVRRQKLREKQKQMEEEESRFTAESKSSGPNGTSSSTSSSFATSGSSTVSSSRHRRTTVLYWYKRLPIFWHIVTTFLLFGAGFDVGMQQYPSPTVVIEPSLAPSQEIFVLRMLNRFTSKKNATSLLIPSADELLQQADDRDLLISSNEEDEFLLDDTDLAKSMFVEPSIDPLFGVDLDLLTQGNSFIMIVARFAVRVHRVIMSLVYYPPLRIYLYVKGTLVQLTKSPPILCVLALIIRQIIGKMIMGASLTSSGGGGGAAAAGGGEDPPQKDIVSMIAQAIKALFMRLFPTFFIAWDVFNHLKNDVYVVLCGLLVGLTLRHSLWSVQWDETSTSIQGKAIGETVTGSAEL